MAGRGDWRGPRLSSVGAGRGAWTGRGDAVGGGGGGGWRGPPPQRPQARPPQPAPYQGGGFGAANGGLMAGQSGQGGYLAGQASFGAGGSGQGMQGGYVAGQQYYALPPMRAAGNPQMPTNLNYGYDQFGEQGGSFAGCYQQTGNASVDYIQSQGQFFAGPSKSQIAGVGNSSKPGASDAAAATEQKAQMVCYRCEIAGHAVKGCTTSLWCVNCAKKDAHLSKKCALLYQPKPVASLIGSAADGLQMFSARSGKKPDQDKAKQAIAIVSVKGESLTALQLVNSLSMMFQWGWEWQAKPYLKDNFLVKFTSMQKIDEMKGYHYFGLIGTKATIKVDRWTNSSIASYKLYVCWVRIDGVPEPLEHYQGFCEAGSLIGNVLELDMELYRLCGVVRAKIGVMDPRKIPASAPLNESGLVYNIFFELEDIVEEGGPLEGGCFG
ncbi:interleukin enhancer-binding factor 3-B-like [Triticum urartu]|uniref:interleukin enhancer-binding factor 3-B-like n=1 Tax=Triticum urartu TaxID=4572 RepID=UPI00204301B6|nr:interleukin enhancer-binding factor 3-B-like [Triticum urartu]